MMTDEKFWEYVEKIEGDVAKIFTEIPLEEAQEFIQCFQRKAREVNNASGLCCDSATDGSYGVVASGREAYEELLKEFGDWHRKEEGGEKLCRYSYENKVKGGCAENFSYRLQDLLDLLNPDRAVWLEPPEKLAKSFGVPLEVIQPLWDKNIRPLVETEDKYVEFKLKYFGADADDQEQCERITMNARYEWRQKHAPTLGIEVPNHRFRVGIVRLVEEFVEVEAVSPIQAEKIALEAAEQGETETCQVVSPHTMGIEWDVNDLGEADKNDEEREHEVTIPYVVQRRVKVKAATPQEAREKAREDAPEKLQLLGSELEGAKRISVYVG